MKKYFIALLLLGIASCALFAQDSLHFEKEVTELIAHDSAVNKHKLILFTGSSSIRLWKSLSTDFSNYNVLNRGFGGSQMTDLIYYFDKLILPYKPKQIFIYEGDNDIASGKTPEQVLANADSLLRLIRTKYSKRVRIVFITPKPSIARWELKDQYLLYNKKLKAWSETKKRVEVVDVWTPLVDQQGKVLKDIFIEDGLHLNAKGYVIWTKTIKVYLR